MISLGFCVLWFWDRHSVIITFHVKFWKVIVRCSSHCTDNCLLIMMFWPSYSISNMLFNFWSCFFILKLSVLIIIFWLQFGGEALKFRGWESCTATKSIDPFSKEQPPWICQVIFRSKSQTCIYNSFWHVLSIRYLINQCSVTSCMSEYIFIDLDVMCWPLIFLWNRSTLVLLPLLSLTGSLYL